MTTDLERAAQIVEEFANVAAKKQSFEKANLCHEIIKRIRALSPALPEGWEQAAKRIGEMLAETGPNGYYDFDPATWAAWCDGRIRALKAPAPGAREQDAAAQVPSNEGQDVRDTDRVAPSKLPQPAPAAPMEPPARKLTPELISAMQKHLLNAHELHPLTHGNIRALCEAAAALASREEEIKGLREAIDELLRCLRITSDVNMQQRDDARKLSDLADCRIEAQRLLRMGKWKAALAEGERK